MRWIFTLLMTLVALPLGAQQLYWYDGPVRRPLWAEAGLVADFSGGASEKSAVLKPAALAKSATSQQSPVFRDHAQGGAARALPGGVLVKIKEGAGQAQAVLARHQLTVLRAIGEGSGVYLVDAPPGTASLALANRLFESGDFESAAPNWWQARRLK